MNTRRKMLLSLASAFVALSVIIVPAIADELLGVITKADPEAKKITVVEKGTDKEIQVTITDDTEYVTAKGTNKVNLEKVAKNIEKAKEKGKKGINATITHEKGVASKITPTVKKKAAANN